MTNNLGLYIHIPFCERKCNYCDFNSQRANKDTINEYVESLIIEIKRVSPLYKDYKIDTIFIGGGTPSILDEENISNIVDTLKGSFNISENVEFTIECNPNSTTIEKLKTYKELGINRLSFGAQSFVDNELKILGRLHKENQIYKVMDFAKNIGFKNINLDLMLGIPEQNKNSFEYSLNQALSLYIQHLSVYSLIIEENTNFYKWYHDDKLNLPNEETEREFYYLLREKLKDNGYLQYEISNFSKPGYESIHNLKYWSGEDYLGLGLGSHSKIQNTRFENVSNLDNYISSIKNNKDTIINKIQLSKIDLINEYIFMGLRKTKGINYLDLNNKFKIDFIKDYKSEIDKNLKNGYINIKDDYIFLTEKGMDFSNLVELDFYRG